MKVTQIMVCQVGIVITSLSLASVDSYSMQNHSYG